MQFLKKWITDFKLWNLDDVVISSPDNGQALIYDSASSKWKNFNNVIDVWNNTTQRFVGARMYAFQATTDASGDAVFNLTTNGLSGGTALFSAIYAIIPAGSFVTTTIGATCFFYHRLTSGNVVTMRGVRHSGALNAVSFCNAGYTCNIIVIGTRN